jgi:hypothetical protein
MVAATRWLRLGASQLARSATMNRHLATCFFVVGAYSFTLLASVPAATADAPPDVVGAPTSAVLSPVTAALADGDDVRARFIFETTTTRLSPASGATAAPVLAALSPQRRR